MNRIVVVGAGLGGLTTAAALARVGFDVTVLEAHVYPGGCAGTFFHQGYRFDAGATLAGGFYPKGPMDLIAKTTGIASWPVKSDNLAMVVHLPDGEQINRWGDERRHQERLEKFGAQAQAFWDWQESRADALWDLALRLPHWPPQSIGQAGALLKKGLSWLAADPIRRVSPGLVGDSFKPLSFRLNGQPKNLRLFVDGQLLISAQATSEQANALYGASALDLPRRGVVHLKGGIGAIAGRLVQAVRDNGGEVLFRQEVRRICFEKGNPTGIETKRGHFAADSIVFNLPPWNIARLLEADAPGRLKHLPVKPKSGWGAFMLYVGLDGGAVPQDLPLHHQIIMDEPMGEGNTIFLSISPDWDADRAPPGNRALTVSTHTRFTPWWEAFHNNRDRYEMMKDAYAKKVLRAAARVIPFIQEASELILPGTPVTFRRFTKREWGWVGGFPQSNLFQNWGPRLSQGMWLVGDSIFPGQSMPAVGLGGLRVAADIYGAPVLEQSS